MLLCSDATVLRLNGIYSVYDFYCEATYLQVYDHLPMLCGVIEGSVGVSTRGRYHTVGSFCGVLIFIIFMVDPADTNFSTHEDYSIAYDTVFSMRVIHIGDVIII